MSGRRTCRAFLRRFEEHLAAARAGQVPPHAAGCTGCAARLRRGVAAASLLEVRPELPEPLRRPAFLHAVHERVAADLAQDLDPALRTALSPLSVPEALPAEMAWPLQVTVAGRPEPVAAPSWLWQRTRAQVMASRPAAPRQVSRHNRVRAALAAALAVAAALLASRLHDTDGTPTVPEIVFVTVPEAPSVPYPVAALRGGIR